MMRWLRENAIEVETQWLITRGRAREYVKKWEPRDDALLLDPLTAAELAFAEAAIAHAQVVMAEGDVAEIVRATKALLACRRAMMALLPPSVTLQKT